MFKHGGIFFEILKSYSTSYRLRCRAVRITLFSFIARGFEGRSMLFQENF